MTEEIKENKSGYSENAIEWYTGVDRVTITVSEVRLKNKLLALSKSNPEDVELVSDNNGSGPMLFHVSRRCLKIGIPKKRDLTEEQRTELAERLRNARHKN